MNLGRPYPESQANSLRISAIGSILIAGFLEVCILFAAFMGARPRNLNFNLFVSAISLCDVGTVCFGFYLLISFRRALQRDAASRPLPFYAKPLLALHTGTILLYLFVLGGCITRIISAKSAHSRYPMVDYGLNFVTVLVSVFLCLASLLAWLGFNWIRYNPDDEIDNFLEDFETPA